MSYYQPARGAGSSQYQSYSNLPRRSFIQPYDTKKRTSVSPNRMSQRRVSSPDRRVTFRGYQEQYQDKDRSTSPGRYLTVDQAMHRVPSNVQGQQQQDHRNSSILRSPYQSSPVRHLANGKVSVPYKAETSGFQQQDRRDTRQYDYYSATPKRDASLRKSDLGDGNQNVTQNIQPLRHSINRNQSQVSVNQGNASVNKGTRGKSYRERYAEEVGTGYGLVTDQSVQQFAYESPSPIKQNAVDDSQDEVTEQIRLLQTPNAIYQSSPRQKRSGNVTPVPYEVNARFKQKDFSTFASNQNVHNRRYIFLGDYEVGKTSLWLRYIFYDQKRADISVQQTPHKDGYIFTKILADGNTDYKVQAWDFLTPLEARQCLNLKIENPEHARYDAININREYISGSDVVVLCYDVMKQHTFEWCRAEATKLNSWGVRKIIFAGNKSDGEFAVDLEENNEWIEDHKFKNFFVCATNNEGTQALFMELDRIDDQPGGSVYTLDCLQGKPTEHVRALYAEEQEIACMQLAWLSFRAEMKYYENKAEVNSFWIRSDMNDQLARDIEREHQIDEIRSKIPEMKEMLAYQVRVAEEQGVTLTAEYEEANRKLMEINIIEERLEETRARIKKTTKVLNWCILLAFLLLLIMALYSLYFYYKKPDESYKIRQHAAEKQLLEYSKGELFKFKNEIQEHMDGIDVYVKNQANNLGKIEEIKDLGPDKITEQISGLRSMINNKKYMVNKVMYDNEWLHNRIVEIKTTSKHMKDYHFLMDDIVDSAVYNRWKYLYDSLLQIVSVQIAEHIQASQLMTSGWQSYLSDYKLQEKPDAEEKLTEMHTEFNSAINDIYTKTINDVGAADKLKKYFAKMQQAYFVSASGIMDNIAGLPIRKLSEKESRQKCISACRVYKTDVCTQLRFLEKENFASDQVPKAVRDISLFDKYGVTQKYRTQSFDRKVLESQIRLEIQPTMADIAVSNDLQGYYEDASTVQKLIVKHQDGLDSDDLKFVKIQAREPNDVEKRIQGEYTDATCLEAEQQVIRHEKNEQNFILFIVFLILFILILFCFCGCSCVQQRRKKRKNNFFGHNNGEDRLIIDHHWQEESSEPKDLYINVRDKSLLDIQVAKASRKTITY